MNVREIVFYRMESGVCPVEEFLDSLTGKQAQKAAWVLRLVEELDSVPAQYFKKLSGTDDIWEVRIQMGGEIIRLLGFFYGSRFVVLTNGFAKKTRKTPDKEIELAERRKRDYMSRNKKR